MTKILIAGIGNIFLGDDGFGPAVLRTLADRAWPAGVEVRDFGIRGMDLAFALTSGLDVAILVDATARGGAPGTLYLIEPHPAAAAEIETHAMDPARVLAFASTLGALPPCVRVIGVEPAYLPEGDDIAGELSPQVRAAIPGAIEMIDTLIHASLDQTHTAEARCTS